MANAKDVFLQLVQYAESLDTPVVYDGDLERGFARHHVRWNLSSNKLLWTQVEIPVNDSFKQSCVSIAHELGHHLDFVRNYKMDCKEWYDDSPSFLKEVIAWFYAYSILKKAGFRNWAFFYRHVSGCLLTYVPTGKLHLWQRAMRGLGLYMVTPTKKLKYRLFQKVMKFVEHESI